MRREPDDKFIIDLDRDRIKTVVREAYNISKEFLVTEFSVTADEFVAKLSPYLDSNRVTIPISLELPSKKYPGMRLDVDFRRRKVFARVHPPSKQATLNHMLKAL
jgi:hypothetical protein